MKHRHHMSALAVVVTLASVSSLAQADVNDDCIAANEKAIALRKSGKLLDARAETAKCAVEACGADVQRVCLQRADDINAVLPSILFELKDQAGADVTGAKITVDGRPAENATIAAVALDPGEHTFVFEIPGQAPLQKTFLLREGERQRRERIVVGPATHVTPIPTPPPTTGTDAPQEPHQEEAAAPGRTQRIVGLSLAGVGVVGLVLGTVFGLSASSKWDDAQSACGKGCGPDDPAQGTKDDAKSAATLSTIFFATGGVLAAGGLTLFFTAPKSSAASGGPAGASLRIAPQAGPRTAGISLGGSF